jgi:hypothetical protein
MKRRKFLKNTVLAGTSGLFLPHIGFPVTNESGELLYNGIRLPEVWPPQNGDRASYSPMPVPYLASPPEVIPIDIGRQLFVDDFLIEKTDLKREFFKPQKLDINPVFKPETELEQGISGTPAACPKDGGVWWDPRDKVFKMWYEAGWLNTMAYATSSDGIDWERPELGIQPCTNRILPDLTPDSTTVFLDHFTEKPNERYKMFLRSPNTIPGIDGTIINACCMVSADGIHWGEPVKTGICGDRSTMFYNPFRKKWVFSIRSSGEIAKSPIGRARYYREHSDFMQGAKWEIGGLAFWTGADNLDPPDSEIGEKAQLYNLSAVAYESLMIGFHEIHLGPKNEKCMEKGVPKTTELMISFSRDGFHWHRPFREAFIPASRKPGSWDRGYVQPAGGICLVVGDKLWFYYTGFRGDENKLSSDFMCNGMYANGSTGVAVLRRDGFVSMSADPDGGSLTTRLSTFNGKYLFVNAECPSGELKVELLDEGNSVISPYTAANCQPVSADSTIQQISWGNSESLSELRGKKIRFRFYLKNGKLYSFWVSKKKSGASFGYNAAGGPGFSGGVDIEGIEIYRQADSFPRL